MKKNLRLNPIFWWCLLFVVMLAMNMLTPLSVADDGAYAFIKEPVGMEFDDNRPIRSLSDIVESMTNHWKVHNGRITSSFFESLFAGILGKTAFNFLNALIFCFTIGFFLSLCRYEWRSRWNWFVMLLFLALIPAFNETFLWFSGSFNYLWTAFFVLGFLLLMRRFQHVKLSMWHWVLMPIAFICGWTHEVMTLPVSMALGLYFVLHIRKIWGQAVLPLMLGFMFGTAMNILGPATFTRAGADDVVDVVGGVVGKIKSFAVSLSRLRVFWLFLLMGIVALIRNKKNSIAFIKTHRWLLLITLFSLLVILLSGMSNSRVRFGTELFSLMLIVSMVRDFVHRYERPIQIMAFAVCFALLIPIFYYQKINYDNYQKLLPQLENQDQLVILTPTDTIPQFWRQYLVNHVAFGDEHAYYLACDKEKTMVRYMSAFYGKRGMIYFPEALYRGIKSNPEGYHDFKTIPNTHLYVQRVDDETIPDITFELGEVDKAKVPFYLRPFVKWISAYSSKTVGPTYKKIIELDGQQYLVIPAPKKEMAERVVGVRQLRQNEAGISNK